ncbi:hypothetical protein FRUB_02202 [Fimbriiglobus ruber]|uniref:Uncharacterized protein n=1 Tax=Fimbriiglobus ruber TaxID=1908690 RepID=A0A225DS35_9BACT|nr:hypothetical protein FRUB_02202 [Fimbriiglobus ruber]
MELADLHLIAMVPMEESNQQINRVQSVSEQSSRGQCEAAF